VPGVTTGQPFRSPYHRRRRVGERNPVLRPSAGQWEAMGSIALHRHAWLAWLAWPALPCIACIACIARIAMHGPHRLQ